jgi:hypothetical protein
MVMTQSQQIMNLLTKQYPNSMILTNNPAAALNREIALKAHINYIVRDYALENICTDHIEWTHKKVSKVSVFWLC